MRPLHERMLEAAHVERRRLASRRGLLIGGTKLAVGGALAFAGATAVRPARYSALAQDAFFEDDLAVLNYALTLEHLETAFYRDGVPLYDFGTDPFGNDLNEYLAIIGEHEAAHVETLTSVISDLGGEPVAEATYDFGHTDAGSFLALAQAVENLGVSAYDGAGAFLENKDLLTAAGTIVAVEARHASYLNLVNGEVPFPGPVETPMSPEEVLEVAGPFIVS